LRVLLAEDDQMIGASMRSNLERERLTVDWVRDADAAERALQTGSYDLLLLDLGLPKRDGLQLLKQLRRRSDSIPVIIVTARDAVSDRVEGLDAGADDYVIKPFDSNELAARIRALIRRRVGRASACIEYGDLVLDPAQHSVHKGGQPINLSPREFAVLMALLERPGAIWSRAQLEERLYGWDQEVESNAVEVHIHGLRKKLGATFIRNVRGVGYRV
jgi:two-component system, OmpR family, response regulator QseB